MHVSTGASKALWGNMNYDAGTSLLRSMGRYLSQTEKKIFDPCENLFADEAFDRFGFIVSGVVSRGISPRKVQRIHTTCELLRKELYHWWFRKEGFILAVMLLRKEPYHSWLPDVIKEGVISFAA